MSERTALEIADEHDAYDDVPQAKEVAAMLRSQDAEIYRLRRERRHIYDLLARIHRDGGQYTAEHGVEKSCDDAEAQVVTWLDTINSVDALIEQARIAEREACADVCKQEAKLYATQAIGNNTGAYDFMQSGAEECEREIRARGG